MPLLARIASTRSTWLFSRIIRMLSLLPRLPRSVARTQGIAKARSAAPSGSWPLTVSGNGRYLQRPDGSAFLIHGDTAWSLAVQLTHTQIDTYLNDRQAKGFTAIMVNAVEHYFGSQSPAYRNAQSSADPFTMMSPTDFAVLNNTYWTTVDYIVNEAKARGIAVLLFPAYLGAGGGGEGWMSEVTAESAADLQAYGAALATRYTQGNVIWALGGDYAGTPTERAKQWNIVTGIRSVRTTDIVTAHAARTEPAFPAWNGYAGFNLNTAYINDSDVAGPSLTEYGRAGPMPYIMIEGYYNGDGVADAYMCRRQAYQSLLSGACGHMFGQFGVWDFGSPIYSNVGVATSLTSTYLNSTATQHMVHVKALFDSYQWHKLEPKTDASFVSSALGGAPLQVCPARAIDGTFAFVYVPNSQTVTLVKSALTPSLIRVRLYDPTTGGYTTHTASTANTGTLDVATGGERVIVVDAA